VAKNAGSPYSIPKTMAPESTLAPRANVIDRTSGTLKTAATAAVTVNPAMNETVDIRRIRLT